MQVGLALLRTIVGGLFMGHGLQKLTGWFGGHGLKGTGQFFEALDLKPGVAHAAAAGVSEAGGGALIAAGLQTPLGAAALSGTMITAIRKVHLSKGVWASDGGYEYNLVLLAVVFALSDVGPGRLSLDAARGRERKGLGRGARAAGRRRDRFDDCDRARQAPGCLLAHRRGRHGRDRLGQRHGYRDGRRRRRVAASARPAARRQHHP
jgi:putative oxidoreductase